jgi:hypothetical protein
LESVGEPQCTGEGPPCTGLLENPLTVLGDTLLLTTRCLYNLQDLIKGKQIMVRIERVRR